MLVEELIDIWFLSTAITIFVMEYLMTLNNNNELLQLQKIVEILIVSFMIYGIVNKYFIKNEELHVYFLKELE